MLKVLATDGTAAMVLDRPMQWAGRRRLPLLSVPIFNKLNAVLNTASSARAEFGPRFVADPCHRVVINGEVRGGRTFASSTR